ncbi:MAG TPA: SCP2 sterol-binding domain-containing protein [Candidatus Lokiarchaeia archaeon]|nr:SCP2 sterol-binding domain-containing protein [Candidatus Lokiarchaeia archaeon]
MVDLAVAKEMRDKLANNTFQKEDIPGYVALVTDIGNENPDMAKEVIDWDRITQVIVMDSDIAVWIQTQGGKYSWGPGINSSPNLTFRIKNEVAADIISGRLDANKAYITGELILAGDPIDGARFRTMRELAYDILKDMKLPEGGSAPAPAAKPAAAPAPAAKVVESATEKPPAKKAAKKTGKKAAKKAGKKAAKKAGKKAVKKAGKKASE